MGMERLMRLGLVLVLIVQLSLPSGFAQVITANPGVVGVNLDKMGGFSLLFGDKDVDKDIAGRDMKFFLTGIAFPIEEIMVDLNIYNMPENVVSPNLMGTELAKVFLDADIKLKEMVKQALSGDEVAEAIEEVYDGDGTMPAFRVWIQPETVTIAEAKDRASAEIKRLHLGVNVEFSEDNPAMAKIFQDYVIPGIEKAINNSAEFSVLRRAISAVILADWYKKRSSIKGELSSLVDTRYSKIGESKDFWVVRQYLDRYITSYYGNGDEDFITGGVQAEPKKVGYEEVDKAAREEYKQAMLEGLKATELVTRHTYTPQAGQWYPKTEAVKWDYDIDVEELKAYLNDPVHDYDNRVAFLKAMRKIKGDFMPFFMDRLKTAIDAAALKGEKIEIDFSSLSGLSEFLKGVEHYDTNDLGDGDTSVSSGDVLGILLDPLLDKINENPENSTAEVEIIRRFLEEFSPEGREFDTLNRMLERYYEENKGGILFSSKEKILDDLKDAIKDPDNIEEDNVFKNIGFDGENFRLGWARPGLLYVIEEWIEPIAEKLAGKKNVIVVGMGGSINSVKLMKEAYKLDNVLAFDTPDRAAIEKALKKKDVDLEDTAVVLISKSGTTYETHTIARILKDIAREKGEAEGNRIIKKNFLWLVDKGNEGKVIDEDIDKQIRAFPLQPDEKTDIGGRFSSPWTGVYLIMEYLWFVEMERDNEDALSSFYSRVYNMIERWRGIIFNPFNSINKRAYEEAFILSNILYLEGVGPRVAIVIPKKLRQHLSDEAIEAFRIWLTQLWQESIGGKAPERGIMPKIEVLVKGETSKERKGLLKKNGFRFINLPGDELYENMGFMYMLATYFSAFNQINYLGQGNVQLYKDNLKKIETPQRPGDMILEQVITSIHKINGFREKPFIDVVLYGPYTKKQKAVLRDGLNKAFPDKLIFIYDGPDYNHHSFEALAKDKYTMPVLLVHPDASEDVVKVAQATEMVFNKTDVVYGTAIIPEEKLTSPSDVMDYVFEHRWRAIEPRDIENMHYNSEGLDKQYIKETAWAVLKALKSDDYDLHEFELDVEGKKGKERDYDLTLGIEKEEWAVPANVLPALADMDKKGVVAQEQVIDFVINTLFEYSPNQRLNEIFPALFSIVMEKITQRVNIKSLPLDYVLKLALDILVSENMLSTDSREYKSIIYFLYLKHLAQREGRDITVKAVTTSGRWNQPEKNGKTIEFVIHPTSAMVGLKNGDDEGGYSDTNGTLGPLGLGNIKKVAREIDKREEEIIRQDMAEKRGEFEGGNNPANGEVKKPGGIWIGMDVNSMLTLN